MSAFYDYRTLHAATKEGIEHQGGNPTDKPCGCHQRGEYEWEWWLCSYHEGFEDGAQTEAEATLEVAEREQPQQPPDDPWATAEQGAMGE